MKVLLIDVYHYNKGGAETVCFNTGNLLKENGNEVAYFTLKWENNTPSKFEKYFPESKETRKGLFRNFFNIRNYFYYPDAAKKLEQLIIDEKPDIAHIHLMWGQISPSIFPVLKQYKIPIVFTIHDYRIVCPAYSFKNGFGHICEQCNGKHFYKCILNKCTKGSYFLSMFMAAEQYFRNKFFNPCTYINGLLYVSKFAKEKHEKYMPALQNIENTILYNFSTNINKQEKKVSIEKYYLFLGRLSEEKGLFTLLKAFKNCPEQYLKIVGDGPLKETLIQYKKNNQINNVEFLGYKSGDELIALKNNAYFTIVPSEWYENNPMAIIESYALGVPVIGTNIGGIPEIIINNKTGYIFNPSDINSLIELVMKSDKLSENEYSEISKNTLNFAEENFSKRTYYNKLLNFYSKIILNYK